MPGKPIKHPGQIGSYARTHTGRYRNRCSYELCTFKCNGKKGVVIFFFVMLEFNTVLLLPQSYHPENICRRNLMRENTRLISLLVLLVLRRDKDSAFIKR